MVRSVKLATLCLYPSSSSFYLRTYSGANDEGNWIGGEEIGALTKNSIV